MYPLTPEHVSLVYKSCLMTAGESAVVQGLPVRMTQEEPPATFNIDRLNKYLPEIGELLSQLPLQLYQQHGQGASIVYVRRNRGGDLWGTPGYVTMLVLLGMATGGVQSLWLNPKKPKLWKDYPLIIRDYVFTDSEGVRRHSDGKVVWETTKKGLTSTQKRVE